MEFSRISAVVCAAAVASFCGVSCISVDDTLGQDYIPASHKWQVINTSLDIESMEMAKADELGGYSSRRICVGGVKDSEFGWDEREAAFSLIPIADTADFSLGENPEFVRFHFAVGLDTISVKDANQERIIQNIRVYELQKPLDQTVIYAGKGTDGLYDPSLGTVTEGVPTYNGGDSLSFDFSRAFGEKYMEKLSGMKLDSVSNYIKELPGICICADRSVSGSGRINMFKVAVSTNDYNYITGNYAELSIRSTFDERGPIDTSIVFMVGAASMLGASSTTLPTQYSFNICRSENLTPSGAEGETVYIGGGCGMKPVIRAEGLKQAVTDAIRKSLLESLDKGESFAEMSAAEKKDIAEKTISEGKIVINKATVQLPYETDTDYSGSGCWPKMLSPTCRLVGTRTVKTDEGSSEQEVISFAGLTDASVSSENQGDINRSLDRYQPDVSHHIQELLRLSKKDGESDEDYAKKVSQYDIWMLIMHSETNESTSSSSSSSYNDYLSALAYSSYYNSLYNGYGYGGYGSYGYGSYGYGSYYNNYYNYMMMAAYASQSSTTSTSTSTELDKDRYYSCRLHGPKSAGKRPTMTITYSFPTE